MNLTGTCEGEVYLRFHCLFHSLIALMIALAATAAASAQTATQAPATPATAAAPATTGTGTLRGHVTDPTGALIPGAQVTITTSAGTVPITTKADASGSYSVPGLSAGGYIVNVTYDGFAP